MSESPKPTFEEIIKLLATLTVAIELIPTIPSSKKCQQIHEDFISERRAKLLEAIRAFGCNHD